VAALAVVIASSLAALPMHQRYCVKLINPADAAAFEKTFGDIRISRSMWRLDHR